MKIELTQANINALKPSEKGVEYFDKSRAKGTGALGIRVSPTGKMTWFMMYSDPDNISRRWTLGLYPSMTKAAAETAITKLFGTDPAGQKRTRVRKAAEKNALPTMNNLWDRYTRERRTDNKKAQSTIIEEDRKWTREIEPVFGDRIVNEIKRGEVSELLLTIKERGLENKTPKFNHVMANRIYSFLHMLFKRAIDYGFLDAHPIVGMKKPGEEEERERVLSESEIRTLWNILDERDDTPGDIFKMILLTAQRPGEVAAIHWNDIDLKECIWDQKENKTNNPHKIPLSTQALDVINNRQITDSYGWIFPSIRDDKKHVVYTKKARLTINKEMKKKIKCESWTPHDLRRTAATMMGELGIDFNTIDRIQNHKLEGTKKVYIRSKLMKQMKDALQKWGDEIDRITGQQTKPQGKIIQIKVA